MKQTKHGRGSVVAVRRGGEVVGYRALLPRHLTRNPSAKPGYREPVGGIHATEREARAMLDAAIVVLREQRVSVRHGLPFSSYVDAAIKALRNEYRREYGSTARANKRVATWQSINRLWLPNAPFYSLPPEMVEVVDLQAWIDWLRDEAESSKGEPLSGSFIRQIASLLTKAFERARLQVNPAASLKLPKKGSPRVEHLSLDSQVLFFRAEESAISDADRTMAGCGMGAGLRVSELLAMEVTDVHLLEAAPYLIVRYGGPDHAPPKGRGIRRVELFEPGLGFWRRWMKKHYRANGRNLVFAGPRGGYLKAWPESFPGWAHHAQANRLSSHIMRHTYAVSMLSGLWRYEPKSLEFVSKQLGHADIQTTERYYGAWVHGTWQQEVQRMTGRVAKWEPGDAITAEWLLGIAGSPNGSTGLNSPGNPANQDNSRHPPQAPLSSVKTTEIGSPEIQCAEPCLAGIAQEVLELAEAGDGRALARAIDLAQRVIAARDDVDEAANG